MDNGIINSFSQKQLIEIFKALEFASIKHSHQKRKGIPYINHPIQVAHLLIKCLHNPTTEIIVSALLHDTLEDTNTNSDELKDRFGDKVLHLVEEVSDNMKLSSLKRKKLQITHAHKLSAEAGYIKIADKTCNIRDMLTTKINWTRKRKITYIEWAGKVISRISDKHKELVEEFKNAVKEAETILKYKFNPEL